MDILERTLETSEVDDIQLKSESVDDPKCMDTSDLTIIDEGSMSDDGNGDSLGTAEVILDDDGQWKTDNMTPVYRFYSASDEVDGETVTEDYQSSSGHLPQMLLTSNGLPANHICVVVDEVLTAAPTRSLVPRSNIVETRVPQTPATPKVRRDDKRRATHNEVERRRRDKINNWIFKLSKIIPDCSPVDNSKSVQSKGCILAKACEYIAELRQSGQQLSECLQEIERLTGQVDYLKNINEKLRVENALLRRHSSAEPRRTHIES